MFFQDIAELSKCPNLLPITVFTVLYLYLEKCYHRAAILVATLVAASFAFLILRVFKIPESDTDYTLATTTVYVLCAYSIPIKHHNFIVIFAFTLSTLIGISRIVIGVHSFAELIISLSSGFIFLYLFRKFEEHDHKVEPSRLEEIRLYEHIYH